MHGRTPRRRHGADQHLTADAGVEDRLRELAPRVLGVLVRRYEDFAGCEDAVQEALVAAAQHRPKEGVPGNPHSSMCLPGHQVPAFQPLPTRWSHSNIEPYGWDLNRATSGYSSAGP